MREPINLQVMSRRRFLGVAGTAGMAVLAFSLAGCGSSGSSESGSSSNSSDSSNQSSSEASSAVSGTITAVGSTALQPLVEAAAEQYMQANPNVTITVQGGGSGQGITQIAQGAVQIGDSDVFAESKLDNPDDASKLTDNRVCVVGMGPVVNKDAGVTDLTMQQLQQIFTGQVTSWKDLGGADEDIVVINRASGSGTRATFEDAVLKDVQVPESFKPQEQDSSGTVAKMVAETPGAISYLAFSYFSDDFTAVKVDGTDPTSDNVATNEWPIWAYEHMYTAKDPDDATADFISYMMGDDVQGSLVEQTGYIPVTDMKVERDKDGNIKNL